MTFQSVSVSDGWVSLSDAARQMGLSTATVSRKVAAYERDGLISSRMAKVGAPKFVNMDDFRALVDRTRDGSRAATGALGTPAREARRGKAPKPAVEPREGRQGDIFGEDLILSEEQARRVKFDADLKELQLKQRRGELIGVIEVREAMANAGGVLARGIDQLPSLAEEIASAVAKAGSAGARGVLKEFARTLRQRLAGSMSLMAGPGDSGEVTE